MSDAPTVLQIQSIVSDPNVRNGVPVIVGTGIRVVDVVAHIYVGDTLTPEAFAQHFRVEVGHVLAALAYYHLHKTDLDAWMAADDERARKLIEQLGQQGKATKLE